MTAGTRRILSFLALAIATGLLFVADGAWYLDRNLLDSSAFAGKAVEALESEPVRRELARELERELERQVPGANTAAPEIQAAAEAAIDTPPFRRVFRAGVLAIHRLAFDEQTSPLLLDLRDVGTPLLKAARRVDPGLARYIPVRFDARVAEVSDEVDRTLADIKTVSEELGGLADLTLVLGLLALAASVLLAVDRNFALIRIGLMLIGIGIVYLLLYYLARQIGASDISSDVSKDAVQGTWDAVMGGLRTQNIVLIAAGLLLCIGVTVAGRRGSVEAEGWEGYR